MGDAVSALQNAQKALGLNLRNLRSVVHMFLATVLSGSLQRCRRWSQTWSRRGRPPSMSSWFIDAFPSFRIFVWRVWLLSGVWGCYM